MRIRLAVVGLLAVVALFAVHQVPVRATARDVEAIHKLFPKAPAAARNFDGEVALILQVQDRVLAASPEERGIGLNHRREIADLVSAGHGACFDRSRAIETVLRYYGFKTRHASVYSTAQTGSALRSLATKDTISHALTEVKTSRGWMALDSKVRWAGLTADGRPIDLGMLRRNPNLEWGLGVGAPLPEIFSTPYTWVYGLYSRHGRFYPPYDPIPDVNWGEMAQNL